MGNSPKQLHEAKVVKDAISGAGGVGTQLQVRIAFLLKPEPLQEAQVPGVLTNAIEEIMRS